MTDSITQVPKSAVAKPPMAMGSIPKPDMRRPCLNFIKRWTLPVAAASIGSYLAVYFLVYQKHQKQYTNYINNLDPDKLYHEMKEYGAFKNAKASWQE